MSKLVNILKAGDVEVVRKSEAESPEVGGRMKKVVMKKAAKKGMSRMKVKKKMKKPMKKNRKNLKRKNRMR